MASRAPRWQAATGNGAAARAGRVGSPHGRWRPSIAPYAMPHEGGYTGTGHGRCVRRWGCHRVLGARGKALFREMVESLFREEFPAGFTIAVGDTSALKVFADHSDWGAKDIRKGLQKIG